MENLVTKNPPSLATGEGLRKVLMKSNTTAFKMQLFMVFKMEIKTTDKIISLGIAAMLFSLTLMILAKAAVIIAPIFN